MNYCKPLIYIIFSIFYFTATSFSAYEENDGVVIMEFENGTIPTPAEWTKVTNIVGYTGSGALSWNQEYVQGGVGVITFNIKINKTGRYYLQYRATMKEQSHKYNDCFVNFVNGNPKYEIGGKYSDLPTNTWYKMFISDTIAYPTWGWGGALEVTQGVTAGPYVDYDAPGEYQIQFSGRSNGFTIDRVALSHSDVNKKTVQDTTLDESPGGNGGGTVINTNNTVTQNDMSFSLINSGTDGDGIANFVFYNKDLFFTLEDENDSRFFTVVNIGSTPYLDVISPLDFESQDSYRVTITATDGENEMTKRFSVSANNVKNLDKGYFFKELSKEGNPLDTRPPAPNLTGVTGGGGCLLKKRP